MRTSITISILLALALYALPCAQHTHFTPHTSDQRPSKGPGSTEFYKHAGLSITDHAADEEGYWIYEPTEPKPTSAPVVIFMHGYGALNPMIYGKWIKHLVAQGNIVIYPRYQTNLISPKPDKFPMTGSIGIKSALKELQNNQTHIKPELEKVIYVGHSYGGAINAYIGVHWASLEVPKPAGMVLVQPGTGPLDGALLKDYAGMPSDMALLTIAGEHDFVVGDKLAKLVFETAVHTPDRNYIMHYADTSASKAFSANHHDPYAIDLALDNGVRNITVKRAMKDSRIDLVDYYCYFKLTDALIAYVRNGTYRDIAFGNTPEQRSLGKDMFGVARRQMQVWVPQQVAKSEN